MVDVIGKFRRDGDLYVAEIYVDERLQCAYMNIKYENFILALSDQLKEYPGARLLFIRTDYSDTNPWLTHTAERDAIRDEPDKYIAANTGYDRRVLVRDQVPVSVRLNLRCSYDTLADSFGDNLYIRIRDDGKVECPFCGRWSAEVLDIANSIGPDGGPVSNLQCKCLSTFYETTMVLPRAKVVGPWVELETLLLLSCTAKRFYLPRSWNSGSGWIAHDDLMQRYDQYLKETQNVRE